MMLLSVRCLDKKIKLIDGKRMDEFVAFFPGLNIVQGTKTV